jgi:hypothetical protein
MHYSLHSNHAFFSPSQSCVPFTSKSCILLSIPVMRSFSIQVMHSSVHPSYEFLLYTTSLLPSYTLISHSHFIIILPFTVTHSCLLPSHALFLLPVMHSSLLLSHEFFCTSQSCILLSFPVLSIFPSLLCP